jgi:hypothetical protein
MKLKFDTLYQTIRENTEESGQPQENSVYKQHAKLIAYIEKHGERKAAIALINVYLRKYAGGLGSDDMADTATFANGIDGVEDALEGNDYIGAISIAKETAQEMLDEEGFSAFGMD